MSARKTGLIFLVLCIALQFIRPAKNNAAEIVSSHDLSKVYKVDDEVHRLLIKKCYDYHSNTTCYPWYYNIQPVGWWLAHHVSEGKEELNFSAFKSYDKNQDAQIRGDRGGGEQWIHVAAVVRMVTPRRTAHASR